MTCGWHTSTYEWHTDDIRVHTSVIGMTYEYTRVTYGWHTSTYDWHTNGIRVHIDKTWAQQGFEAFRSSFSKLFVVKILFYAFANDFWLLLWFPYFLLEYF